jgi:hypothetical protein
MVVLAISFVVHGTKQHNIKDMPTSKINFGVSKRECHPFSLLTQTLAPRSRSRVLIWKSIVMTVDFDILLAKTRQKHACSASGF